MDGTTNEAVGGFAQGLSIVLIPYILATTVIMSRVARELSPGVTPPVVTTVTGTARVSISTRETAPVKTETAAIPVSIPVSGRVGRTVVGVPAVDEFYKVGRDTEFAIRSATPVPLTMPRGTPTEVGVVSVGVVSK